MTTPLSRKALPVATLLIGIHSCVLGIAMLSLPVELPRFMGFRSEPAPFFASQSGIFLLLLGVCYLLALRDRALLTTIVVSKAFAVAFLVVHAAFLGAPALIWAAAAGDASMLAVIVTLMRMEGVPLLARREGGESGR